MPTTRHRSDSGIHEHSIDLQDHYRLLRPGRPLLRHAVLAVTLGIVYLPVDPWTRGFLAIGSLFLVTSSFTLAKCVRDAQESSEISSRLDRTTRASAVTP